MKNFLLSDPKKIGVVRLKTTTKELKGVNTQEKRLRTQLLSFYFRNEIMFTIILI